MEMSCHGNISVISPYPDSAVQNPGSPDGPPIVDGWVVRFAFGLDMLWSEMTIKPFSAVYCQPSPGHISQDLVNSLAPGGILLQSQISKF